MPHARSRNTPPPPRAKHHAAPPEPGRACAAGTRDWRAPAALLVALFLAALASACSDAPDAGGRRGGPPARGGRVLPAQVLFQAQPDLTDAEAEALWATPGTVRAVLLVQVGADGTAANPRVKSVEPKGLPVADAFAQAVIRSLPEWRFRPATRDGQAVAAELEVVMEAEGGGQDPEPR